ncbi:MAG: hypothetical protein Q9187_004355 [Circinaria calcarea]
MNTSKPRFDPKTQPLPMAVPSIDPTRVLHHLKNLSTRLDVGYFAKLLATRGKICFQSLTWNGNSDVSSRQTWDALKHWAGVFMDGFDPMSLMTLGPFHVSGKSPWVDAQQYEWIHQWVRASIDALERFTREYPGEKMRKVDWKEKVVLGKAFDIGILRVRDAKASTAEVRETVEQGKGDEDWVDVGDSRDAGNAADRNGMDISKEWMRTVKAENTGTRTCSVSPAYAQKRIILDWQHIGSNTNIEEDSKAAAFDGSNSNDGTEIVDSITAGKPERETNSLPVKGNTEGCDDGDEMEDALFDVLDDGTILYNSLQVCYRENPGITSCSNKKQDGSSVLRRRLEDERTNHGA